jgi:molybdopterin-guanine dinucleotide biosynthesis protein A
VSERRQDIDCCAVILAGGLNTRMNGRNKAFLTIGGRTILDMLLESLQSTFPEIMLVTRQPDLYSGYPVRVVEDIYTDRSSLTGIHAGLVRAKAEYGFMVPCDTPFLQFSLIRLMLAELEPTLDAVVPFYGGHYQPLCAIYSKRCIPVIEDQLNDGDYKIIHLFDRMNVRIVPVEKITAADPDLLSFLNVNTPEAYAVCRKLSAKLSNKKE